MFPQKKWGPALLPAPTAPSEGYAGVRNLIDRPEGLPTRSRSWLTSSGVASHPTAPSEEEPTGLPDCAARGFAGPSPDPASLLEPKSFEAKTVRRSAALLGSITLASRFAHLPHKEVRSRVALEEDRLFRRLFPADPEKNPKALSIACRRRSDLWSPAAPSCRCRLSGEAGTAVPITCSPCTCQPSRKSEKWGEQPVDNGDIGNNHMNLF